MKENISYLNKSFKLNLFYPGSVDTSVQGTINITYFDVLNTILDFNSGIDFIKLSSWLAMSFFEVADDKNPVAYLRIRRDGLLLDMNGLKEILKFLELDGKIISENGLYRITEQEKKGYARVYEGFNVIK